MKTDKPRVSSRLLAITLLFYGLFYVLQLSLMWYQYQLQHASHKVFRSFELEQILNSSLSLELLKYYGGFLLLHLCAAFLFWFIYDRGVARIQLVRPHYLKLGVLWSLVCLNAILLLNKLIFPYSTFSLFPLEGTGVWLAWGVVGLVALSCVCLVVLAFADCCFRSWKLHLFRLVPLLIIGVTVGYLGGGQSRAFITGGKQEQPNIILIGVDSLRPDQVSTELTPAIKSFLDKGVTFEKAVTPQGRTYAAWVSLLTGMYPRHHGARFNLLDETYLTEGFRTIGHQLQETGYRTVFAMDERRYSNITYSYGFEEVVGPPIGAIDFILAFYGDVPLVNLLSDTWLVKTFFPSLYANRAVASLYRPHQFQQLVHTQLQHQDRRPLFLATHFCLPHWPYLWATSQGWREKKEDSNKIYHHALRQADNEVSELLNKLEVAGYLTNALVVLFSDHGENLPGERTPYLLESGEVRELGAFGHGSSILQSSQNNIVLSMRGYGAMSFESKLSNNPVSLLDIAPTINAVTATEGREYDGISLLPVLKGEEGEAEERSFFIETGFYLPSMEKLDEGVTKVASEASKYYQVNDRGLVRLKDELIPELLRAKQRGVIRGDLLLAVVPENDGGVEELLLDMKEQKILEQNSTPTLHEEVSRMKGELCDFYQEEIAEYDNELCKTASVL